MFIMISGIMLIKPSNIKSISLLNAHVIKLNIPITKDIEFRTNNILLCVQNMDHLFLK